LRLQQEVETAVMGGRTTLQGLEVLLALQKCVQGATQEFHPVDGFESRFLLIGAKTPQDLAHR